MQQEAPVTKSIPVHDAARFSDSTYWTGHAIGAALIVFAVVVLIVTKGPRRHDAVLSLVPKTPQGEKSSKG